jgi:hypothetical protein
MWGLQYDNSRVLKKFLTISGAGRKRHMKVIEIAHKVPGMSWVKRCDKIRAS